MPSGRKKGNAYLPYFGKKRKQKTPSATGTPWVKREGRRREEKRNGHLHFHQGERGERWGSDGVFAISNVEGGRPLFQNKEVSVNGGYTPACAVLGRKEREASYQQKGRCTRAFVVRKKKAEHVGVRASPKLRNPKKKKGKPVSLLLGKKRKKGTHFSSLSERSQPASLWGEERRKVPSCFRRREKKLGSRTREANPSCRPGGRKGCRISPCSSSPAWEKRPSSQSRRRKRRQRAGGFPTISTRIEKAWERNSSRDILCFSLHGEKKKGGEGLRNPSSEVRDFLEKNKGIEFQIRNRLGFVEKDSRLGES